MVMMMMMMMTMVVVVVMMMIVMKKKKKDFYIKHRILSGAIIAHGLSQLWLLILTPSPVPFLHPRRESILIAHFIDSSPRPGAFAFSFQFARN